MFERACVVCIVGGALVGCTSAPERPLMVEPESSVAVATPSPAPASPPVTAAAHCAGPVASDDEARALASWLARNPVPTGFTCPGALRVVQREPWYVATSELVHGGLDQHAGPTRRMKVGERVTYWAIDGGSGDALTVSLGRLDAGELAAAGAAALAEAADARLDPPFETESRRLAGPWRGLDFEPRAGAAALAWRGWLAAQPGGRRVESFVMGWHTNNDEELARQPRLLHWTEAGRMTLCIVGAEVDRCWTTAPTEIEYAVLDPDAGEQGQIEVLVRAGRARGSWSYDLAARRWTARGAGKVVRTFTASAEQVTFPPALRGGWVRSLGDGWAIAGDYDYNSQGLVPRARWVARRHASTWQLGALGGDESVALAPWQEPDSFALLVGYEELSSGDGLGYSLGELAMFRTDGEWLAPAGWLPLPLRGMARMRGEGGWEYEHSLTLAKPRCLAVALRRSVWWTMEGETRREAPLTLPMPSLAGAWTLGPEGLVRGC